MSARPIHRGPVAHATGAGRPPAAPAAERTPSPLQLDPIACVGHGLCAELFPEGVVLDDWGFPILLDGSPDPALRAHAKRAVKACPALALRLRARSPQAPRSGSASSQARTGSSSS